MISSFVKRLSSRLTRKSGEDKSDETDAQPSLSSQPSVDKTPLSKQPTVHLEEEESLSERSSSRPSSRSVSKRFSSERGNHAGSLSKKISAAAKTASLTSRPTRTVRAPSLTAQASQKSITGETAGAKTKKTDPNVKTLWYLGGSYVTVRNDEDGWFLCRLQHNVYNTTKSVKVRWLSKKKQKKGAPPVSENDYVLDYRDEIDPACILLNVVVTRDKSTYTLYHEHMQQTQDLLEVIDHVASGKLTTEDVDSDVEEVVQIEPPAKKRKTEPKKKTDSEKGAESTKKTTIKKRKGTKKESSKGNKVKKAPGEKKKKESKQKTKKGDGKEPKRKTARKKDDLVLHPNPDIEIQKKDPFFETYQSVPFVSKYAHSRLVFRAVLMKDYKLLKKLCKDTERVRQLTYRRSVADKKTALHLAITLKDEKAIELLTKEYGRHDIYNYLKSTADPINVDKLDTGSYNVRSLGVAYIRPIMASRGSREGNNALTKDLEDMQLQDRLDLEPYLEHMMMSGLDLKLVKGFFKDEAEDEDEEDIDEYSVYFQALRSIDLALERGHYKLAGQFMQDVHSSSTRSRKVTPLHYEVLLSETDLKSVPPSQITRGIKMAYTITPVHCAACNPDTRFLKKLLAVEPEVNIADKQNRRPIHFAAGCEGTGPLELLLSDDYAANMFNCDRKGNTPMHLAVQANRLENVKVLLNAGARADIASDDQHDGKYGIGGINRPNRKSFTPLHQAAENGNLDIVKLLVKNGANVNAVLNTTQFKLTPLMMAAQFGYLDIADFLVKNGAVVQQKDRLGRTSVIHAAMNGNTNVLSFLLNIGAGHKICDSSGNSPLHYAAAYGWYFCVKTLLDAGADVNVGNDWKTTPLSIAYLKGHMGIVTLILKETDVDVNFQDDEGMTLVSHAASSVLCPDLYDQMSYLIKDKGAFCTFKDVNGSTPLHYLALNNILLEGSHMMPLPSEESMEVSVKIARLLMANGCDFKAATGGETAAMMAMRTGNIKLFKFLVESECPVLTMSDGGQTILHTLCSSHMLSMKDYLGILKYAVKMDGRSTKQNLKQDLKNMARLYCHDGMTPLLYACQDYRHCSQNPRGIDTEEVKSAISQLWKDGRDFIKFLIDELDSDVDAIVREKHYEKEEDRPDEDFHRYLPTIGKWSAAEMLANLEHRYGDKEDELEALALRMILKYKPNMNTRDMEGHTPLTRALMCRNKVTVQLLVKESNADVGGYFILKDHQGDHKVWPAVLAAESGDPELLDIIVKAGTELNVQSGVEKTTALHAAIHNGDRGEKSVQIIQTLCDHGADVNGVDKHKRTPLHYAVSLNEGRIDENFDVILTLLSEGADLTTADRDSRTPLHYVFAHVDSLRMERYHTQHDPIELCRIIASRMKPKDLNKQDKFGMTALHKAAFRGANISCIYLMEKGADRKLKDIDGNTALSMALKGRQDGCAAILIQNGASLKDHVFDPENTLQNKNISEDKEEQLPEWKWAPIRQQEEATAQKGISVFEFALQHEFQGVCFLVMEKPVQESGITFADAIAIGLKLEKYNTVLRLLSMTADLSSLHKECEHGRNLLHILSLTAQSHDEQIEKVVTELVEKGVSLTKQDDYKCTPLLYASLHQNFELCGFYMKTAEVYNPKYTDSFHRSVLSAAFWRTNNKIDVDHTWWAFELHKKKAGYNELIDRPIPECLLESEDIADPDYWKKYDTARVSPLIIAINYNSLFFTQWFLKAEANVNFPDSLGRTPLMHAARVNDLTVVKTLMNFQYDPNATEEDENEEKSKKKKNKAKPKMKGRIFKLKRNASFYSSEDDEEEEEEEEDEEEVEKEEEEEKTFKPFKKKSNVNLNAVDKNGWNVIHHCASPLSFATFDNDEMVFILAKAGAKLNVKNKDGDTPLDLAIRKKAFRIAQMIQELEGVSEKNRRKPQYSTVTVNDNVKWSNPQPSFEEDAQRYLDKLGEPMDVEEEYVANIDSNCRVTNGTLVKDDDLDLLYDVLLTKVDVNLGVWGLYNFYQIQLVHQPGKYLFILFTRWGRIGDEGQYQHTPFQDKDSAAKEFCKIFREKTGNTWADVKRFEKKPMKYRLVHNSERRTGRKQPDIEFENKSTVKSRLPQALQQLLKKMTSVECLKSAMARQKIDSDIMPFGRLQRDILLKARVLLEKISVMVEDVEAYRSSMKKGTEEEAAKVKDRYQELCEEIGVLSSEYYQVIPQKGFSFEKIRPLDKRNDLHRQIGLVNSLLNYERASRMLLGAKYREKDINPLDYVYHSLGCQIQPLLENDEESQFILRAITSCHYYNTKIEAIYRLKVEGEQTHMDKQDLDNHSLLWHHLDVDDSLGVLQGGLVNRSQGVQFSDTFENVQIRYGNDGKSLFMLLCEVALGKTMMVTDGLVQKPKAGYDSVLLLAHNKPVEHHNVRLSTGCLFSLGSTTQEYVYKGQYISNYKREYHIFDESQICLRYLIQYRL